MCAVLCKLLCKTFINLHCMHIIMQLDIWFNAHCWYIVTFHVAKCICSVQLSSFWFTVYLSISLFVSCCLSLPLRFSFFSSFSRSLAFCRVLKFVASITNVIILSVELFVRPVVNDKLDCGLCHEWTKPMQE